MSKILVTGGAGMIDSNLVKRFVKKYTLFHFESNMTKISTKIR
jgi:nucleoside-diphosphate-sugar epimerase